MSSTKPNLNCDLTTPPSRPPTLASLQQQVTRRRRDRARRRRVAGSFIATAGLALVVILIYPTSQQGHSPMRGPTPLITSSTPKLHLEKKETNVDRPDLPIESHNQFRVLARVRQPLPIFQRDEASDQLLHVGWMASEEVVPVDVNQFLPEQQQSIQAVLTKETAAQFINL